MKLKKFHIRNSKSLCRECLGTSRAVLRTARERKYDIVKSCTECVGTGLDPIPWSELFTPQRKKGHIW